MKTDVYTRLLKQRTGRRSMLKGTASVGAAASRSESRGAAIGQVMSSAGSFQATAISDAGA